ncbi:MAG TPA: helix-turn-helix transcriptional regulator [Anaerolineales bacterium]|nr:helix-turn-helix transcriptional regulator [Anaerolineales bacterium]
MNKFGEALRIFRQLSNDPDRHQRRLSQSRLGELIGHQMEDRGFSGAAVSDWERGKSKLSAEDRHVLLALIKVLHKCGGLPTLQGGNQLLEAGDYRALNRQEAADIFGETAAGLEAEKPTSRPFARWLLEALFEDWESISVQAQTGPQPSWPRTLAAFMRKASEHWSISFTTILWIWVWLFAWWLTAPSLRWPFADRDSALLAIGTYVTGTLIVPLLVGLLINTKNNEYWQRHGLANSALLRLYTYQGAGIGFNLGYFFVFPLILTRYYLQLEASLWLEFAAVTLGLLLANMSARVVPHNLWLAYGRLHFADGGIFFVVALLGPLWGIFFLEYYPVLLTPLLGSLVILLALTSFVVIAARQSRKKA